MKKFYIQSIITILCCQFSFGQLDSIYRVFQNQTRFSKAFLHNNQLKIVGINKNIDDSESIFSVDVNSQFRTSKATKADIKILFKKSIISSNSIDGTYLAIVYENYFSPYREIYKIDYTGKILFHKSISDDSLFYPSKIIQTLDSGFLITGYNLTLAGYYSAVLMKINSKGSTEFYKNFSLPIPYSILGYGLSESMNNYYLLLSKENGRVTTPPYFEDKSIVYKLNKDGDSLASIEDNEGNISIGNSDIISDEVLGHLYTGHIIDSFVLDTIRRKTYYLKKPFICLKSNIGNVVWRKTFSKTSEYWSGFYNLKKMRDGNYLAVGDIYNANSSDSSFWGYAVKFSRTGNVLWEKTYRNSFLHKFNIDRWTDFVEEINGDINLIGSSYRPMLNDSTRDDTNIMYGWALKLDNHGNQISSIASKNLEHKKFGVQLFPNPSSGIMNIEIDMKYGDKVSINMYNSEGKLTMQLADELRIEGKRILSYNLSHLPKGVYFIETSSRDRVENQRIILE